MEIEEKIDNIKDAVNCIKEDMDYIPDNLKIAFADAKYDICDTIE